MVEWTGKMSESPLPHMCYLECRPQRIQKGVYIFPRCCRTLGNIFQSILTGYFNIIDIRNVYTRNGSIYIIMYISWKWWFINAYMVKAISWRCFNWTWFDNIIYNRDITYITRNKGTVLNHTREEYITIFSPYLTSMLWVKYNLL